MTIYAFHFAARSIQDFLVAGGRLRDAVGASEMVEALTGDLLDQALAVIGPWDDHGKPPPDFSRRGGGVFTMVSKDKTSLARFQDLWSLAVTQFAPGLAFQHALAEGDSETKAIANAGLAAESDPGRLQPPLPSASPLAERSGRTGTAAVCQDKPNRQGRAEFLDASIWRKRGPGLMDGQRLVKRVSEPDWRVNDKPVVWPRVINADERSDDPTELLPFPHDYQVLGIVHADGNNMGKLFNGIEGGAKTRMALSEAVAEITQAAARRAALTLESGAATLKYQDKNQDEKTVAILPGRPILLGGDDLVMVVRGDFAIRFARTFLEAFEEESQTKLKEFQETHPESTEAIGNIPKLTACAGIAFIKSRQPFFLGLELAHSLCDYAKQEAKKAGAEPEKAEVEKTKREEANRKDATVTPSALAFHRVTTNITADFDQILADELTIHWAGKGENGKKHPPLRLTHQPYGVGDHAEALPQLKKLRKLTEWLDQPEIGKGHARELLSLLTTDQVEAKDRYRRLRENLKKIVDGVPQSSLEKGQKNSAERSALNALEERLGALLGNPGPGPDPKSPFEDLPAAEKNGHLVTPLGDAFSLLAISRGEAS